MKNKIIGIFICILLIISVLPITGTLNNVNIDLQKEVQQTVVKKLGHTLAYSEQDLTELRDRVIPFGEQLSVTETQNEKESTLWDIALLYDEYGFPAMDMTVEETFELLVSKYQKREFLESQYDEKRGYNMGFRRHYFVENGQVQMIDVTYQEILINDLQEDKIVEQPLGREITEGNHTPIYIDGNDDFIEKNGVTGGSGTEIDPYIIENWVIVYDGVAENGFFVNNTDAYFIIRNCTVRSFTPEGYLGVKLNNVKNGRIEDTETFWNYGGLGIWESEYVTIFNCTSHDNEDYYSRGIYCSCCSNITISSCEFYNHNGEAATGMELFRCSYCVIENTSSHDNFWSGLEFRHGLPPEDFQNLCKYNLIKDCKFYNNKLEGMSIADMTKKYVFYKELSYNHILRCEIYNCGFPLLGSDFGNSVLNIGGYYNGIIIEDCNIHDNGGPIAILESSDNIIKNCSVYNHSNPGLEIVPAIGISGWFIYLDFAVNNTIINCEIYDNEQGITMCEATNSIIYENNIFNNSFWGIKMDYLPFGICTGQINYNNIFGNGHEGEIWTCGLYIDLSIVDARYNWWGAKNGPKTCYFNNRFYFTIPLRFWGNGDKICRWKSILFYRPWEKEPFPDAGVQ